MIRWPWRLDIFNERLDGALRKIRRPEICINYNISGEIIEKNESVKDLGVTFDNKLKFDDHINKKISTLHIKCWE